MRYTAIGRATIEHFGIGSFYKTAELVVFKFRDNLVIGFRCDTRRMAVDGRRI